MCHLCHRGVVHRVRSPVLYSLDGNPIRKDIVKKVQKALIPWHKKLIPIQDDAGVTIGATVRHRCYVRGCRVICDGIDRCDTGLCGAYAQLSHAALLPDG